MVEGKIHIFFLTTFQFCFGRMFVYKNLVFQKIKLKLKEKGICPTSIEKKYEKIIYLRFI